MNEFPPFSINEFIYKLARKLKRRNQKRPSINSIIKRLIPSWKNLNWKFFSQYGKILRKTRVKTKQGVTTGVTAVFSKLATHIRSLTTVRICLIKYVLDLPKYIIGFYSFIKNCKYILFFRGHF